MRELWKKTGNQQSGRKKEKEHKTEGSKGEVIGPHKFHSTAKMLTGQTNEPVKPLSDINAD